MSYYDYNPYRTGDKPHRVPRGRARSNDPDRAALDRAIESIRATAEDRGRALKTSAEAEATRILGEAEAQIAAYEAQWALANAEAGPSLLLTVAEAAKLLGVSTSVIYKLFKEDRLPSVTVGTRRYVRRTALTDFVEQASPATATSDAPQPASDAPATEAAEAIARRAHRQRALQATAEVAADPLAPPPLSSSVTRIAEYIAASFGLEPDTERRDATATWYEGRGYRLLTDARDGDILVADAGTVPNDDEPGILRIQVRPHVPPTVELPAGATPRLQAVAALVHHTFGVVQNERMRHVDNQ